MSAKLKFNDGEATLDRGVWKATTPRLRRELGRIKREDAPTEWPDPDRWMAETAAERLDGEIVQYTAPPSGPPGRRDAQ